MRALQNAAVLSDEVLGPKQGWLQYDMLLPTLFLAAPVVNW